MLRRGYKIPFTILIASILFWLAGCTTTAVDIKTVKNNELALLAPRVSHFVTTDEKYISLPVSQPGINNNEPQWALAMSGGGTRSASFNIGVLSALQEGGVISQLDYISSVSGGSYASYWFYSQEYYRDKGNAVAICNNKYAEKNSGHHNKQHVEKTLDNSYVTDDIFLDKNRSNLADPVSRYRFQNHLENGSHILNHSHSKFVRGLEDAGHIVAHVFTLPLNWITQGLFDWSENVNASPAKIAYRHGLERTYGLVPCASDNGAMYANDKPGYVFRWNKAVQAENISFNDLNTLLKARQTTAHRLPVPIINTTVGWNGDVDENLARSVFSFSPDSFGTPEKNYPAGKAPLDFSRAVAASGAAVDAQAPGFHDVADFGLFLVDGNLGYRIPNPDASTWHRVIHWLLPFPLYYADGLDFTQGSLDYDYTPYQHLSDGGHSDNLGVYPLVMRGVKNIIVVDAEHDPDYVFEALKHLAVRLKIENGYSVQIDKKNIYIENDKPTLSNEFDKNTLRTASNKQSVVIGTVKNQAGEEVSKMIYLKLSFDRQRALLPDDGSNSCRASPTGNKNDPYPCSIVDFYTKEKNKASDGRFPHNSTADVFYDSLQFRAYRDLGYILGREQLLPALPLVSILPVVKTN